MPLLSLPVELLTLIAEHTIEGDPDLYTMKTLRETCKFLETIARATTFETVTLYPNKKSCVRCRNLQNHPELSLLVRTVVLNTFVKNVNWEGEWEMTSQLRETIMSIGRFPNVRSVQVELHLSGPEDGDENLLRTAFAGLNDPEYPTPNLRTLTIKNLQALSSPELTESRNFKAVLSRLSELHLFIATPRRYWGEELSLHEFFEELPTDWLEPTQNRLTRLTLYASTYWGWAPKFDPRGLHFPNLNYLALGNHTFTHDWQVDWILSHGSSLATLILDDCPILFCIYPYSALKFSTATLCHDDHTEYTEHLDDPKFEEDVWLFDRRWHNFFPKFETGLLYLTKFVYGCGTLDNPNPRCKKSAFELRNSMLPALRPRRYVLYNGNTYTGICHSQWIEADSDHEFDIEDSRFPFFVREGYCKEVLVRSPARIEPPTYLTGKVEYIIDSDGEIAERIGEDGRTLLYPVEDGQGCQKQDEEAFTKLLSTVHRRAREKGRA